MAIEARAIQAEHITANLERKTDLFGVAATHLAPVYDLPITPVRLVVLYRAEAPGPEAETASSAPPSPMRRAKANSRLALRRGSQVHGLFAVNSPKA